MGGKNVRCFRGRRQNVEGTNQIGERYKQITTGSPTSQLEGGTATGLTQLRGVLNSGNEPESFTPKTFIVGEQVENVTKTHDFY